MTALHIFYIPTIFLLGYIFGKIVSENKSLKKISAVTVDPELPRKSIKNTTSRSLLLSFLIFLGMLIITHAFPIPYGSKIIKDTLGGLEIFDKQPSFSNDEVYARIEAFSARGIELYQRFTYSVDLIFPLSFFYFLFTFARFVSASFPLKTWSKIILALPVTWLISDLLENLIIYSLLAQFPHRNNFLGSILGMVTAMKFTLLILSILTPTLLYIFGRKHSTLSQ